MARVFFVAMVALMVLPLPLAHCYEGYFSPSGIFLLPNDATSDTGVDLEFDKGWGASLAVGVMTERGWRGELELAFLSYGIGSARGRNTPTGNLSGDVQQKIIMGNLIREFAIFEGWSPFVGAGAGFSRIDLDFGSRGELYDTVFAYQGILGVAFPLTDYDYFDIQYRYFDAFGFSSGGLESNFATQMLMLGIRLGF